MQKQSHGAIKINGKQSTKVPSTNMQIKLKRYKFKDTDPHHGHLGDVKYLSNFSIWDIPEAKGQNSDYVSALTVSSTDKNLN